MKYKVIQLPDLMVVVDENPKIEEGKSNYIIAEGNISPNKIIATIGKRLQGVPMIENPDEISAETFANRNVEKILNSRVNKESIAHLGLFIGFEAGYKSAAKKWTEDIKKAFDNGKSDAWKDIEEQKTAAEYLQSLQPVITGVELESVGVYKNGSLMLKIDIPDNEGGIITNAKFYYNNE